MERTRILIMGAAGRDFHNFNVVFRDDPTVEVVAFTKGRFPRHPLLSGAVAAAFAPGGDRFGSYYGQEDQR